jgi:hypothetical protein
MSHHSIGGGYNNSANLNAFSDTGSSRESRNYKDSDFSYDMFSMIGDLTKGAKAVAATNQAQANSQSFGLSRYPKQSRLERSLASAILSLSPSKAEEYKKRYQHHIQKWLSHQSPSQKKNDQFISEALKYVQSQK